MGGSTALPDSAWWQLQLLVENPWSMTGGPFVCFLAQTGVENAPLPCEGQNLGAKVCVAKIDSGPKHLSHSA